MTETNTSGLGGLVTFPQIQPTTFVPIQSNRSPQIGQLVKALAQAQTKFLPIKKTIENKYYGSKYADLSDVIAATQPSLAENGLIVTQLPIFDNNAKEAGVQTILAHSSGEYIQSELKLPSTGLGKDSKIKFDAQTIGIAITYARRYAYQSIVGVASEADDDGNAISEPGDSKPIQRGRPPMNFKQPAAKNPQTVQPPKAEIPETGKPYVATDEDLPTQVFDKGGPPNITPATTPFEAVFPTKPEYNSYVKESKGYIEQLKGVIEDPNTALRGYFLRETGKADIKNLTRQEWDNTLKPLRAAETKDSLAAILTGKGATA